MNQSLEPSSGMRFGLFGGPLFNSSGEQRIDERGAWQQYIDEVIECEALGYHGVFLTEHHFTGIGQVSSSLGLLAHMAARTSRIRLGTAVTVLTWHNPVHLVEQANTVDLLSGGRLDFGVGRGYRQSEFDGFGIPMDEAQSRYDEALEVLLKAWTSSDRWSHEGERWRYTNVVAEPHPIQKPHPPIWVASSSEGGIRSAASRGFNVLLDQFASFDEVGKRVSWYHDELSKAGEPEDGWQYRIGLTRPLMMVANAAERERAHRERAELIRSVARMTGQQSATQTKSSLAAAVSADTRVTTEEGAIIGDVDECVERLEHLRSLGVGYVLFMEESADELSRFAADVAPRLQARDHSSSSSTYAPSRTS